MTCKTFCFLVVLSLAVFLVTSAVYADEGMWLLSHPPMKLLKQRYDFEPTPAWLENIQKSCVRFGWGGSASIVSANGLIMTNHHVGSWELRQLSSKERNLRVDGFYARNGKEELPCPTLEALILWSTEDVTKRVNAAVEPGMSTAEANGARKKRIADISRESQEQTDLYSEVITLYHGARYHLYRYRKYPDVRLVMAAEEGIAQFGGDNDNFEYPRFCLDVCFFRIYEDGKPLQTNHYLPWSEKGAAEGDIVFTAGHPYATQRLYTVDHLKFMRDVFYPTWLQLGYRREVELLAFAARSDEYKRISQADLHGVQNSRKGGVGMLAGLQDPQIMLSKIKQEKRLRDMVEGNPEYQAQWGGAWGRIAAARRDYRQYFARSAAMGGFYSKLFLIARHLVCLAEEKQLPDNERLPEYRDSQLESLYRQIYSPAPIHDDLEIDRLTSALSYLVEKYGGDDPLVVKALAGKSPRARAEILVQNTKLKDVEARKKITAGGTAAIADSSDPMILFALTLDPESRALRKRYEDEVQSVDREAYAKIAAARFASGGEDLYPDATGSLRLSYGVVKGYREGGQDIPSFTTLAGLYQRWSQRNGESPFDLPQRWIDRKEKLALNTPLNLVSTNDIAGGNSGSPVVNRSGEVVGLIFDGNLHSLVWGMAYTDVQARAISVDVRGIIEALRNVYDAQPLADELTSKRP